MILNKVNGERYIGSAGTDRINVKFRNHLIHRTGAKKTAEAVAKYGIEQFNFYVLEYYPGLVKKENLSAAHMGLIELERKYQREIGPENKEIEEGASSKGERVKERDERGEGGKGER